MLLENVCKNIRPLDRQAMDAALHRQDMLTKPRGKSRLPEYRAGKNR